MQRLSGCLLVIGAVALSFAVTSAAARKNEAIVTTGQWHGIPWRLSASASRDGSYCVALSVKGHERARSCGTIRRERISYMAGTDSGIPAFIVGPVVSSARSVEISFFDRPSIRVRTIVPPSSLSPVTRFFAKLLRCPATARRLIARDQYGIIVARLAIPHRRPKP